MAGKDGEIGAYRTRKRFESPIIFLYGSDEAFVSAAFIDLGRRVAESRSDLGAVERRNASEIAADPAVLGDFFSEVSLFGESRFMAVGDLTERHSAALTAVFDGPSPTPGSTLLLASSSLKTKSKLLSAARACAFCDLIKCYEAPLSRPELSDALVTQGVSLASEAALEAVYQRLQAEDPASRAHQITKLALYAGDAPLEEADAAACLSAGIEGDSGLLIEPLLGGAAAPLIQWRRQQAAAGSDAVQQLSAVARALSDARRARQGGGGPPVFWRVEKTVKAAAMRLDGFDRRLETAIGLAFQAELSARRSEGLTPERTERLLLRLAQIFSG